MRTVPVQLVCRNCASPYRTTVRGGNTRCPHCRTSRHVRVDQEWEGPVSADLSEASTRAAQVATRPAVWVECRCGHAWQSRAKDRMTIRCPECGTGQRVPHRTHDNTGAVPEGHRPPPLPRAPSARPAAPDWEPQPDPEDEWEPEQPEPALGGLAAILAAIQGHARPAPAPAAPRAARPAAPNPPAPAPAAPIRVVAGVQPIDPQTLPAKELRRRDDVCQIARSLSAPLMVWYNQPPGLCEAMDTTQPRDRQRCPATATHAVQFERDVTVVHAFTCPAHARPLAATADHSPYIRATVRTVR